MCVVEVCTEATENWLLDLHLSTLYTHKNTHMYTRTHTLTHSHTHTTTNRWTVSSGSVAPVSTLRPQQPPPSFHCAAGASILFWGFAGRVCTSCSHVQIGWEEWWLFWFPVRIHPLSMGSWQTLPPTGQIGSSCLSAVATSWLWS